MRQGWRISQRKIFNSPIVFFLDYKDEAERIFIYNSTRPVVDAANFRKALRSPRFIITNLTRGGMQLDHFVVRHSTTLPHFYSPKCFEGAIVYGTSDWTSPEAVCKYYDNYQEDNNNLSIGEL